MGGVERALPALDALLQLLREAAIAINAQNAHLDVLVATHIEKRVQQRLLGLVAEGGEVVQHEQKRDVADLRFLQHLRETSDSSGTSSRNSMFLSCAFRSRLPASHTTHTPYDA